MKSLFTYIVLVGVPGAGLLGILHAGRGLKAPHAIGGEWRVEGGALAGAALRVQQSGEHVVLEVPRRAGHVRLRGRLRGDTLEARGPGGFLPGSHACTPVQDGTARLVVDRAARRMAGRVEDGCRALDVGAVYVAVPRRGKGGH